MRTLKQAASNKVWFVAPALYNVIITDIRWGFGSSKHYFEWSFRHIENKRTRTYFKRILRYSIGAGPRVALKDYF